jgi:hypothetical protein
MADKNVLKAVLDNELLTDEVRSQIKEAIESAKQEAADKAKAEYDAALDVATSEAREETEAQVRADLAAKFVEEREELAKALDEKVVELLSKELEELKEDIAAFRDLEVEKALEIEEEKEKLAEQFAEEREALIAKLDEFVEARVTAEMEELSEDITTVKENTFGRQVYEAFSHCFHESFVNDGALGPSAQEKIREAEEAKDNADDRVIELEEELSQFKRERELERVLSPLSGKRKAVMETLLARIETEKFGEIYERMLPKVLDTVGSGDLEEVNESDDSENSEEEVVTESKENEEKEVLDEAPEGTVLETGDDEVDAEDSAQGVISESTQEKDYLRKLAGIK